MTQAAHASAPTDHGPDACQCASQPEFLAVRARPGVSRLGRPPQWAVVGAYPVDADGEIEPRFAPNDNLPAVADGVGLAGTADPAGDWGIIQLAKAGYRPARGPARDRVGRHAAGVRPGGRHVGRHPVDRGCRTSSRPAGWCRSCTSAEHVPADWPDLQPMRGRRHGATAAGLPAGDQSGRTSSAPSCRPNC